MQILLSLSPDEMDRNIITRAEKMQKNYFPKNSAPVLKDVVLYPLHRLLSVVYNTYIDFKQSVFV